MGGGAVIAAASAARRREMERVLDAYRIAGATRIDQAQSLYELGLAPSTIVDGLRVSGVLKPGLVPDSWYLDERKYVDVREARFRRSQKVTLSLVALMLIVALVGLFFAARVSGLIL